MARWEESKHPRDRRGRFATVAGSVARGAAKGALKGAALGYVGGALGNGIPRHRKSKAMDKAFEDIIKGGYKYPRTIPKRDRASRAAIATAHFAVGAERGVIPGAVVGGALGGYKGYKKAKAARSGTARKTRASRAPRRSYG